MTMFRRFRHPAARRLLVAATVFCLAFAQAAAAAYACARAATTDGSGAFGPALALAAIKAPCPIRADAGGTAGAPAELSNLCEVHCQTPSLPDASPSIGFPTAIVASHPLATLERAAVALPAAVSVPPSTAPPDALHTTRLLI